MNPATFLRVLGPEPWSVAYDEPSIRPDDSRYGENPNRLQRHTQFQVILKPAPDCAQELVLGSYQALGIDTCRNDVRFVEDNWESPALGAWGLGWEVWLNGMEVTQFTYFQQAGGVTLDNVSVEVTYGLERIIMALQQKMHFKDIVFAPGITYGDIFMQNEIEMSRYNMDDADVSRNKELFHIYEGEALELLEKRLPVPAYNYVLKASHTFNILDARGAIGVTERARYFQRMRNLSRDVARLWLTRREELEYPLLPTAMPSTPVQDVAGNGVGDGAAVATRRDKADFLLEIGVEELPADVVADVMQQVERLLYDVMGVARLSFSSLSVDGTPRRVCALLKDVQTRQADETKRVRGPPLSVAVKDGQVTKAATGFMRSQGVSEKAVEFDEAEGYMYATVHKQGRNTEAVLADVLASNVLQRINFGKSMRWNESGITFSRPLRWLVCLLDDEAVPVSFAGVESAKVTRSLRGEDGFAKDVEIPSASQYHDIMRELQIVVSRGARAQHIREEATRLASGIGGTISTEHMQGGLLDEITDLVENPIPLVGRFDDKFLELPKEVLESVMKKHQRYLPIVDASGKLINGFVTVANGDAHKVDIDLIRQGNEAVLRARYSDAAFFYEKDTVGKKLADFIPQLDTIVFQETLGSLLDKKNRVSKSVPTMAKLLGLGDAERDDAMQVANLFKADLATSMVMEMTSLAGVIGQHYCEKSGEVSPAVSRAVFEANLPRFSGDAVAKSDAGALVAIADRMDSLVGLFSVGLVPKSTADPFALRRAALGIVQTVVNAGYNVDLKDVAGVAAGAIAEQTGQAVPDDVRDAVLEFIAKRIEGYLLDNVGIRDDVVKTVLAVSGNERNILSARSLCETIADMVENDADKLDRAQEAYSRAARLLGSVKGVSIADLVESGVDEALLDCEEERNLWAALKEHDTSGGEVHEVLSRRLAELVDMKIAIDAFFDGVFVNAEDEKVRMNRLSLCAHIVSMTCYIVDLSYLNLSQPTD